MTLLLFTQSLRPLIESIGGSEAISIFIFPNLESIPKNQLILSLKFVIIKSLESYCIVSVELSTAPDISHFQTINAMIDEHTLQVLEFEKVKAMISSYAVSALGEDEIEGMHPLEDLGEIRGRLKTVSELVDLIAFDDPVPMGGIRDVREAIDKSSIEGSMLNTDDFLNIKETLSASRHLKRYLEKRKETCPSLFDLARRLIDSQVLENEIDRVIDEKGLVRTSASRRLKEIRRRISQVGDDIRGALDKMIERLPSSVIQERLVTIRDDRFVIPIRERQRGKVEGIIHDQSASGATVFVEPLETLELNNELRQLQIEEKREVERILRELTQEVRKVKDDISRSLGALGKLDGFFSKASFSLDFKGTEPLLNDEGKIVLRGARHPILERRLRQKTVEDPQKMVPLDISLGDKVNTLIITGPNAGGKTVALKTVGLLTLMAQCGVHIPANPKSELCVFKKVYADVGDEQSIEDDLSTFSSHVRQLVKVCNESDRDSLVLLDEIGASTDPDEGASLAMAVLETLSRKRAKTVATTHHGTLKLFAHQKDNMENASMVFDPETIEPTFVLRIGTPGSSYAFEIARRLGMPEDVVEEAASITGGVARSMEDLIVELDRQRLDYQRNNIELQKALSESKRMESEYEDKLVDVKKESRRIQKEALEESRRILNQAKALVERTVAEIRSQKASTQAIKEARGVIKDAVEQVDKSLKDYASPRSDRGKVQVGDTVWVDSFEREGVVVSLTDSDKANVDVGKVRVEIPTSQLKVLSKGDGGKVDPRLIPDRSNREGRLREQNVSKSAPARVKLVASSNISDKVTVRRMTFDEASEVVDKYLDDAFLKGLRQVSIIHGKGTGALRTKLNAFLQKHPRVKSKRPGAWEEGGDGVTIVQLDL